MKRIVSVIMVMLMCMMCSVSVFAETRAVGSETRTSTLTISSATATCNSRYSDSNGSASKVVITQSLQKQGLFWTWSTYAGEWTKNTNGSSASLSNKVYNLESGTYRVKTVFTVTDANGKTETITIYSAEKKVWEQENSLLTFYVVA